VIPVINRYQNFKPDIALIGPDIENDYADYDPNYIISSLKLEADEKIIIVRDDQDNPDIFFDQFTMTSYWRRQQFSITAPATGTYYLAVFSAAEDQGKYTLAIGRKEVWKLKDLIRMTKIRGSHQIFVILIRSFNF